MDPECADLSRVALSLTEKRLQYDPERKTLSTQSEITLSMSSPVIRDLLIKTGQLCQQFTLFSELASQDSFEELAKKFTPTVIEELNRCFKSTYRTKNLDTIEWPEDSPSLTSLKQTAYMNKPELEAEIAAKMPDGETQVTACELRICEMGWFYEGKKNFVAFAELIQDMPSSVYSSEFVSALLDENWERVKGD